MVCLCVPEGSGALYSQKAERKKTHKRKRGSVIIIGLVGQRHGQAVVVDRKGLEFEAAGTMQGVDALLDGRVHHAAADVLVHRAVGEAQIVLVGQAGEAVGRRLDEKLLRQAKLTAQSDDLLGGVHPQGEKAPALSP